MLDSPQSRRFRKLLAKWTGIDLIRRKYRLWKSKRAVEDFAKNAKDDRWLSDCGAKDGLTVTVQDIEVPFTEIEFTAEDALLLAKLLSSDGGNSSLNRYNFQRILGTGSFSKVKLAIDSQTGDKVAIKMLDAREVRSTPRLQRTLARELRILQAVNHPNVVKFKETTAIENSVCLVMNYVPGVELFQYVAERKRLDEKETGRILKQLLLAIDYLHRNGIVHRDLKLENILLENMPTGPKITLIDFGLAKIAGKGSLLTTRCGSEEYAAPEIILGKPYNGQASDAWSFGVVMYACLVGSLPFNPDDRKPRLLAERIVSGIYKIPEDISPDAKAILRSLLTTDTRQRVSIPELLANRWFDS